jgi:hypothetical protein
MPEPARSVAGGQSEASIDQVNIWMRSQPWWAAIKGNASNLNDAQKRQILQAAQQNGVQVDEGDIEVDKAGNFNPKGHKLRNTLIVAGIAAATIATMGAAGAFSGAAAGTMAGGYGGAGAAGLGGAGAAGIGGAVTGGGIATGGLVGGGAAAGMATAALPAALGGTLVSTAAPALAGSLSAGSMIGGGSAALSGGTAAATLGTTAAVAPGVAPVAIGTGAKLAGLASSPLASTLFSTATNIYGANKQASVARDAMTAQVNAANHAADLQAAAADKALAYQKEQAEYERASAEATRRGNYDQWGAQRERLGTLGAMLGLPAPRIPAYVPIAGPSGAASGGPLANNPNTGTIYHGPNGPGAPIPDLSGAQAAFNTLFPGETLTPQMVKAKEAELVAAGFTLRPNAKGTVGKIQYKDGPIIDIIQGADSGVNKKQWLLPTAAAAAPRMGTIGEIARAQPFQQATQMPQTAALQMPQFQYQPRTLGDYARNT